MKKLSLFFLVIFLPCLTLAGDRLGNGGGIVSCVNDNGKPLFTKLLDFYENPSLTPAPWTKSGSEYVILRRMLRRLERMNPRLHKLMSEVIAKTILPTIRKEVNHLSSQEMTYDLFNIRLPRGCEYFPVIKYVDGAGNEGLDNFFTNYDHYFGKMDSLQRAGLIAHEAAMRVMRLINGEKTVELDRKKTYFEPSGYMATTPKKMRKFVASLFTDGKIYDFRTHKNGIIKDDLVKTGNHRPFKCPKGQSVMRIIYSSNQREQLYQIILGSWDEVSHLFSVKVSHQVEGHVDNPSTSSFSLEQNWIDSSDTSLEEKRFCLPGGQYNYDVTYSLSPNVNFYEHKRRRSYNFKDYIGQKIRMLVDPRYIQIQKYDEITGAWTSILPRNMYRNIRFEHYSKSKTLMFNFKI